MSKTRTRIKICGLTRPADALGAVEMGLDCLRRYLQGLPVQERIDFEKVEAASEVSHAVS